MTQQIDLPSQAVAVREAGGQQLQTVEQPDIGSLLKAIVDKGVTSDNALAIEKLAGLYERMEAKNAEREYAAAFTELQREIPKIKANKDVLNKDGSVRFTYASYEEIDDQLRPLALKYGFTWSFKEASPQQGRVTKICVVQHCRGHSREHAHTVRIGGGPPGCSDSQVDESAHSYAKRGALCDAFCIRVTHTGDARSEGDFITEREAMDLKTRVTSLGMNEASFLKLGQAKTYGEIRSAVLPVLLEVLSRKEKRA